ncbi:Protein CBG05027 [Caenorhabditis briggsae]|uniref:Protein CBG05027 n=3 Tax=Caenorhabditis briggsae TaxID=6238 RepID=A8WZ04_CAEBR|nr:Protein CBG05027 [Caenorhabditis briggsae]ULT82711.1 hypothetical protein L3Y34_012154 [Caenorhabditis briggsae]CAP25613.1 Protein CBG05027 [Caenorhabditis briggsae]
MYLNTPQDENALEEMRKRRILAAVQKSKNDCDGGTISAEELEKLETSQNQEQPPQFQSYAEFRQWSQANQARHTIIADQSRYVVEGYALRRREMNEEISELTKEFFSATNAISKRDHLQLVNLFGIYTGLYGAIVDTTERDFKQGEYSFINCDAFEAFENFLPKLEECFRTGAPVEPQLFGELLEIRDSVTDAIRDHHQVAAPMHSAEEVVVGRHVRDRYQPFDTDWLCTTDRTDRMLLPYMEQLWSSRMQHSSLARARLDLIAENRAKGVNFVKNLVINDFQNKKNGKAVQAFLNKNLCNQRGNFIKTYLTLRGNEKRDGLLRFVLAQEQFNQMADMVRQKKAALHRNLDKCKDRDFQRKLYLMGAISNIEAQMLVIHKIWALYIDKEKGLFGIAPTDRVLKALRDLIRATVENNCLSVGVKRIIYQKTDRLRKALHRDARTYYHEQEASSSQHFNEAPEHEVLLNDDNDDQVTHRAVLSDDYPVDLANKLARNLWYSKTENMRMEEQIYLAKYAKRQEWREPRSDQNYIINSCTGTFAFYSNASEFVDEEELRAILTSLEACTSIDCSEEILGTTVIEQIDYAFELNRAVPLRDDLRVLLEQEFVVQLQNQLVEGKDARQIARDYYQILSLYIAATRSRKRFPQYTSDEVTLDIVREVVDTHMDYLEELMETPPKRLRPLSLSPSDGEFEIVHAEGNLPGPGSSQ